MSSEDLMSAIPSVDATMSHLEAGHVADGQPRPLVVRTVRKALDEERAALLSNGAPEGMGKSELRASILERVERVVRLAQLRSLVPVVNATGVIVHTNLGRAPLSRRAREFVDRSAAGYTNLEFDLIEGHRGSRNLLVRDAVCELTGAADALVVNNNAAAVLLTLNTLAAGREVAVSRGELIEIGDSFRLPDVFARSGCRLVEVGTTNRTRITDFRSAVRNSTGAFLSAHWSNYSMSGFVERVPLAELVALGRRHGIPVIHDLGSGLLGDATRLGMTGEMTVEESLATGVTVATFSGDKLLGGPQCGIVAGESDAVERMRSNPLMRALRPGKLTLAALHATLAAYLEGTAETELPVLAAIMAPPDRLRDRAEKMSAGLAATLGSLADVSVAETEAVVGGGAAPERTLPSTGVEIVPKRMSAGDLAAALRETDPPVVVRTREGAVVADLRSVSPDEDGLVMDCVVRVLRG